MFRKFAVTGEGRAVVLIRILVGWVFVSEGIQKFLFPDALGAGRFAKIGIPSPEVLGPFVGGVEVLFGLLILIGLLTRLAAIPLLVDIAVAIVSTKIPILLGAGFAGFAAPSGPAHGLWPMLHEARTDFSMFLGLVFLLVVGGGSWSLDALLIRRYPPPHED
jgi:putative oxidoreductase